MAIFLLGFVLLSFLSDVIYLLTLKTVVKIWIIFFCSTILKKPFSEDDYFVVLFINQNIDFLKACMLNFWNAPWRHERKETTLMASTENWLTTDDNSSSFLESKKKKFTAAEQLVNWIKTFFVSSTFQKLQNL